MRKRGGNAPHPTPLRGATFSRKREKEKAAHRRRATDIWFYHLQSQPLARALPAILGKAMERGWRVAIQTVDDLRLKALDDLLWSYDKTSFLPHATARDANAAAQPVLLTTDAENVSAADLRVLVEGAKIAPGIARDAYKRVILLFDGTNEAELAAARGQWSRLKREGFALEYWQQGDTGGWKRTA